jgi:hypothetical protein
MFKVGVKVNIKPYQGDIDVIKSNQWYQQLQVYFNVHNIEEEKNISFSPLKLEGHAQIWWKIHTRILNRMEGDPTITMWKVVNTLVYLNAMVLLDTKRTIVSIGITYDRSKCRVYKIISLSSKNKPLCWKYLTRTRMYS